jgi:tungstate transport system ATP-binding protein
LLFDLDRVCVRLGPVEALQDVSLRLRHGERVALVGANGCGKSTMLRLLNGLLQPAGGRIVRDAAARQALLFQRPYMLRTTARNNIALGLWLGGLGWADARARAARGAGPCRYGRPGRTQCQDPLGRAAAAPGAGARLGCKPRCAAAGRADGQSGSPRQARRGDAGGGIRHRGLGPTGGDGPVSLVFASHNLGQVKRLATRVIYLEHGRVLADLPVDQFFNGPLLQTQYPAAHLFVKGELP